MLTSPLVILGATLSSLILQALCIVIKHYNNFLVILIYMFVLLMPAILMSIMCRSIMCIVMGIEQEAWIYIKDSSLWSRWVDPKSIKHDTL